MIDFAMSADLAWSPPPYWTGSTLMPGALAFIHSRKPSRRSMPVLEVWSWTTMPTLPLPPSRSDMCLAASAAAALLSVAAVVTGTSLSTPESNAMTGIFCALAWSISGALALESSAAKPIAAGFFWIALVSIVTCCSMSCSVGGPSHVIFAPWALASSSAPCLPACQNWCWNPLETIAMYGSSPPPPPPADALPPLVAGSSSPHAATPSASPAATTANHFLPTMCSLPFSLRLHSGAALARHVGVDGDEDHDPEDHVLPLLRDRHDLQSVVEDRDDQRADDRADDRAFAAGERRAADDHGRDRLQLVPDAGARLSRRQAGRDHHAREAG